ncbi:hypothetical protein CC80DRAFT_211376 [Byssothecium circinans]|uniref:Uncharacterized protein n=1 Tax=Byssothecium circinans TaxID=147558 RepID=A0A6A5THP3_9PLEO|nr:hypothetical protein CC80DRAFT_211376 [Byssothecium circinans]
MFPRLTTALPLGTISACILWKVCPNLSHPTVLLSRRLAHQWKTRRQASAIKTKATTRQSTTNQQDARNSARNHRRVSLMRAVLEKTSVVAATTNAKGQGTGRTSEKQTALEGDLMGKVEDCRQAHQQRPSLLHLYTPSIFDVFRATMSRLRMRWHFTALFFLWLHLRVSVFERHDMCMAWGLFERMGMTWITQGNEHEHGTNCTVYYRGDVGFKGFC